MAKRKRKPLNRVRRSILLNESELRQLDHAIEDCGVPVSRGFLLFEAVQAGLRNPPPDDGHKGRRVSVRFWLPRDLSDKVNQLAKQNTTSQQSLLRSFLSRYLANPPWKQTRAGQPGMEMARI